MFRGISVTNDGDYHARLVELDESALGEGDVRVRVTWSTLNYKDALAITGAAPVIRRFPMTPGIDFAGVVEESSNSKWLSGERVLLNGWGVGESHPGGLAEFARVPADWLIRLPGEFTLRQSMAIGTAGYTAMLCILALEDRGVRPDDGEILVTGANGGVGSIAIAILAKLGYRVVASTGRTEEAQRLIDLGADSVIDRAELSAPGKPLGKERWAGVVDTVGSVTLANACATTKYLGVVTACGLAGGMDFPATVAPFILRGVTLIGIDSVRAPMAVRQRAWGRLATDLDATKLEAITTEIGLAGVIDCAYALLDGKVRGRIVVDVRS